MQVRKRAQKKWRGMQLQHTAQMVSFEMINASKASLADCAAEMLVCCRFHGEVWARIGENSSLGESGEENPGEKTRELC